MTYIVWMLRSLDSAPTSGYYTMTYIVWMLRSLDCAPTAYTVSYCAVGYELKEEAKMPHTSLPRRPTETGIPPTFVRMS